MDFVVFHLRIVCVRVYDILDDSFFSLIVNLFLLLRLHLFGELKNKYLKIVLLYVQLCVPYESIL